MHLSNIPYFQKWAKFKSHALLYLLLIITLLNMLHYKISTESVLRCGLELNRILTFYLKHYKMGCKGKLF